MFSSSQSKCLLKLQVTFIKALAQQKQYKLNFWHNKASLKVKQIIPTSTEKEHSFSAQSVTSLRTCVWNWSQEVILNLFECNALFKTGLCSVVAVFDCVRLFKCLISECSIVSLGGTAAGLSEPLAHYSLFCGQVKTPILVTFGQICNFRDPTLVTFYSCIYLTLNEENFSFHIQYNNTVSLLTVNMS